MEAMVESLLSCKHRWFLCSLLHRLQGITLLQQLPAHTKHPIQKLSKARGTFLLREKKKNLYLVKFHVP